MSEYQGEKFEKFLRDSNISVAMAADKLGKNRQTVYKYFKSRNLSREVVNHIVTTFNKPESEIFGNIISPRLEAKPLHLASDPNDYDNDGSRFEELPDGTLRMRVPVVPQRASAGYLLGFQDPEYYEDLNVISIDVFKQHKGHYIAFLVQGESMTTLEPENFRKSILDGWIVIGRELPRHQWKYKLHTHTYSEWVIVHKTDGILIKEIIKHDVEKGIITTHSLNPDKEQFPDRDFHLDDIEQIFNIVQKVIR